MLIELPKWPQMIVTGKSVTVEQAKDIILRTDEFFTSTYEFAGGNNHDFNAAYRKKAGLIESADFPYAKLHKTLGIVRTSYVFNSWGSCNYIGGPHGWCHPDGTIGFYDNIGKWPSLEDVQRDWKLLAEAFPYIDLHVTLMSGEACEDRYPLINLRVVSGKVHINPADLTVHGGTFTPSRNWVINNKGRELGVPMHWYDEFAETVRKALK